MQARFIAFAAILAAFATPAAAQSSSGGIWKTTDGGMSAAPADVQPAPAAPQEGRTDALLELGGVDGESSPAPAAEQGIQSNSGGATPLLVPAVQQVRGTRVHDGQSAAGQPRMDGVVVLSGAQQPDPATDGLLIIRHAQEQADPPTDGLLVLRAQEEADALTDGLMIIRAQEEAASAAPRDPEMPVCGHCGADVTQAAAPAQAARPPRRHGFSLTIAGVTVGSDGVNVAVGDITGDGHGDARAPAPARRAASRRP